VAQVQLKIARSASTSNPASPAFGAVDTTSQSALLEKVRFRAQRRHLDRLGCKERLVFQFRRTSASTAPCTSRRICCLTHCASHCVSRSCEHFPDGFDLHLLQVEKKIAGSQGQNLFVTVSYVPYSLDSGLGCRVQVSRSGCAWPLTRT
jgi:hypothetical protein